MNEDAFFASKVNAAPWAATGLLAVLFVILAVLAASIGTLPGDLWVSHELQRIHGAFASGIWHAGNALGTTHWVIWVLVLAFIVTISMRWWQDAAFLLVVMILRLVAMPIKGIVDSPRPASGQVAIKEVFDGSGFPSGHTLTSTILLGGLAFLAVRHIPGRRVAPLAILLWIVGVAMTGFARVWSGAHWPSDVLGAAIYGVAAIILAANISGVIVDLIRTSS